MKAKEIDGLVRVKVMVESLMAGKEEAGKKRIKVDFISHIVARANGKIVFEVSTSGFMSENPLIKFSIPGAKKGDTLEIIVTDNYGKIDRRSKIIQ